MAGTILAAGISGSLDAKNIVMDILTHAANESYLANLFPTVQVPELTGTVPVQALPTGNEDLLEWEASMVSTGAFTGVTFDLKKDRVHIAVSKEAQFKSRAGDPLMLQVRAAGEELARIMNKKVVTALQTSPSTGAAAAVWSTSTNNFMVDLGTAVASLKPYKPDMLIVPANVYAKMAGNVGWTTLMTGNWGATLPGAMGKIPGYELNVFVDSNVTAKTAIVACSKAPAAIVGQGPVEVTKKSDENGDVYIIDSWRQVKAPIYLTSGSLNKACYVITSAIA